MRVVDGVIEAADAPGCGPHRATRDPKVAVGGLEFCSPVARTPYPVLARSVVAAGGPWPGPACMRCGRTRSSQVVAAGSLPTHRVSPRGLLSQTFSHVDYKIRVTIQAWPRPRRLRRGGRLSLSRRPSPARRWARHCGGVSVGRGGGHGWSPGSQCLAGDSPGSTGGDSDPVHPRATPRAIAAARAAARVAHRLSGAGCGPRGRPRRPGSYPHSSDTRGARPSWGARRPGRTARSQTPTVLTLGCACCLPPHLH